MYHRSSIVIHTSVHDSLFFFPQSPLCLVLVPTRELGVQIVMLVYKLFGGSVNAGVPGEASNMFSFTGPRGLKVRLTHLQCNMQLATGPVRRSPPRIAHVCQ